MMSAQTFKEIFSTTIEVSTFLHFEYHIEECQFSITGHIAYSQKLNYNLIDYLNYRLFERL